MLDGLLCSYKEGDLIDLCIDFLRSFSNFQGNVAGLARLTPHQMKELRKFVKGIQVTPKHRATPDRPGARGKVRPIMGIDDRTARTWTFQDKSGAEMNVEVSRILASSVTVPILSLSKHYFQVKYHKALAHPNLPLVKIGDAGWPMEVCKVIPGQLLHKTKKAMEPIVTFWCHTDCFAFLIAEPGSDQNRSGVHKEAARRTPATHQGESLSDGRACGTGALPIFSDILCVSGAEL